MISGWKASDVTAAAAWSQQYSNTPTSENGSENSPPDEANSSDTQENPEWEKARQALAKVTETSPNKASAKPKAQNEVTSANNNVMNSPMVAYGQYYQPYPNPAYPGYPYPSHGPPVPPFAPYGFPPVYPYTPNGPQGTPPPMPYQPFTTPQQDLPSSSTTEPMSSPTQSQSTEVEPNDRQNSYHPPHPNSYNRPFQSQSGGNGNQSAFNSRINEEDQENRDFQSNNGYGFSNNRQQHTGASYANAVKGGGQKKTFWRLQRNNLPRPWSEGNTEEHKFQTKRFKPAFDAPSTTSEESEATQNDFAPQNKEMTYRNQKQLSPKPFNNQDRNPSPPKNLEPKKELSAQEWPQDLRNYVQRCFSPSRCKTEDDKDEVEFVLKRKLTKVFEENTTFTVNWDDEPLPKLKSSLETKEDRTLDRWNPSRRRSSARQSPPAWRKRGRSRSPDPSQPKITDVKGRLGPKNTGQKNGPKQKIKVPKSAKGKKGKKGQVLGALEVDPDNVQKINKRALRFQSEMENSNRSSPNIMSTINSTLYADRDEEELDWSKFHVVGTCQDLKKNYYRLTATPDPSTVRPKDVLKKSLVMIKDHWKANQSDYRFVCVQFKSIRQDLTVQGIRDEFTVEVYETHARIALEKGDREEFNQCQMQLKSLYANNTAGNVIEFTAYRLLYHLLTNNTLDYSTDVLKLKEEEKQTIPIKHVLRLCSAWALSNYHNFFQLYLCAPNMSGYLIDLFLQREREAAIRVMVKSWVTFVHILRVILFFLQEQNWLHFLQKGKNQSWSQIILLIFHITWKIFYKKKL